MNLARQIKRLRMKAKGVVSKKRRKAVIEPLEPRLLLSDDHYVVQSGGVDSAALLENSSSPALTGSPLGDAAGIAAAADAPAILMPQLSPLRLVDGNPANLAGQVFYLNHDGAPDVTYDGPVRVEGVEVPSFQAPLPLAGQEPEIISSVLTDLNQEFADLAVTFTDVRPATGMDYSTIFLDGNDLAFSQYGSFLGLAEKVDVGNQDRSDNAFVFSNRVYAAGMTARGYESALTAVIDHEARHLLGYAHTAGETGGLSAVADVVPALPDGATITVNSTADTNTRDAFLTLREAILLNNRDPSLPLSALTPVERALVSGTPDNATRDTIRLQILSSGVQTIFVGTGGLPYITDPVIIDGTTQPGFSSGTHMPIIEIDASGAGVNKDGFFAAGLEITGGNSVVKGLIIGGARGEGIRLRIGGGNTIIGNFIGTDFTGTNGDIYGNDSGILILDSANNQIGGANEGERNLISGNRFQGIEILGGGSTGNQVQGNLIGTDITGSVGLGNGTHGVLMSALVGHADYASDNLIGGSLQGQGNVISGNQMAGVLILRGARNRVQRNLIGTTEDGTKGLGNALDGVLIEDAPDTLIGGDVEVFDSNVISANRNGIAIVGSGTKGTIIQQNLIGTNLAGEQRLGNLQDGIFLGLKNSLFGYSGLGAVSSPVEGAPSDTTIGGTSAAARNIISGNDRDGVHIEAGTTRTFVQGNFVGLINGGNGPLGNTRDGVAILNSFGNTIGGVVDEIAGVFPRNVISANEGAGVRIMGAGSANNHVLGNFIGTHANGLTATTNVGENIFGNRGDGVVIDDAGAIEVGGIIIQPGNVIGDATTGGRNVISGNLSSGVFITGASRKNTVLGNYIGTDRFGNSEVRNGANGIFLRNQPNTSRAPSDNTIGGDSIDARNVISGNAEAGVKIAFGATETKVWGNYIGTKANGVEALGNAGQGVLILDASNNDIGGFAPVPGAPLGNVISGNRDHAIYILFDHSDFLSDAFPFNKAPTQNRVRGNIIGLDTLGISPLRNVGAVEILESSNNTIGGKTLFERNIISGNIGDGIQILGGDENSQ